MTLDQDSGPATQGPKQARYTQELSRSLSIWDNMLLTLSSVSPASGIFVIAPAAITGIGGASATAFLIAAIAGVAVAMCYAELATAFPVTGGEYPFIARTLGKAWGFGQLMVGTLSGILILGVFASGVGTYLSAVWSSLDTGWVAIAVMLGAAVVACFQVKANAWITGLFLAGEMVALVVLTVLGLVHVEQPVSVLWQATTAGADGTLTAVSAGVVVGFLPTALFAYNGYQCPIYYVEETKNASTAMGRIIMASLAVTVFVQIIPLVALLLGTPSMQALVGAKDPVIWFMTTLGGPTLNTVVSLTIAIAVINAVLAILINCSRSLYASARDNTWPKLINGPLAKVHPRTKTPIIATLAVGVMCTVLLLVLSLKIMLILTGATVLIAYLLTALAALSGRITGKTDHASYRMPCGLLMPIIMLLLTAGIIYQSITQDWVPVVAALGLFAVSLPYYYLYLRRRPGGWDLADATAMDES